MPGRDDGLGVSDHASKVMSMRDAVARFVHDGDTVVIEGFTHLICFAAGHEIIRQGRRDLTLARLTPDLIYDQMIGAGCARKLVFSWAGNPGVGSLHAFRRAVEAPGASPLEIAEYSHFGMVARFSAGAARLPFWPLRDYMGTDLPRANPEIKRVTCPYTVEALVDEQLVRSDPNRTVIPGMIVDAVVVEPWGAHPSYAQGYYDRDNDFYVAWEAISRDPDALERYLDDCVRGVSDRAAYLEKHPGLTARLKAAARFCSGVNYGF